MEIARELWFCTDILPSNVCQVIDLQPGVEPRPGPRGAYAKGQRERHSDRSGATSGWAMYYAAFAREEDIRQGGQSTSQTVYGTAPWQTASSTSGTVHRCGCHPHRALPAPQRLVNPFEVDKPGKPRAGTREEVIEAHERYLTRERSDLLERLGELEGKTLAYRCKPRACHGDVLLRLAEVKRIHR